MPFLRSSAASVRQASVAALEPMPLWYVAAMSDPAEAPPSFVSSADHAAAVCSMQDLRLDVAFGLFAQGRILVLSSAFTVNMPAVITGMIQGGLHSSHA